MGKEVGKLVECMLSVGSALAVDDRESRGAFRGGEEGGLEVDGGMLARVCMFESRR